MYWWALFLLPGQAVEADNFPRPMQMKAVAGCVRVVNRTTHSEGSGVILGSKNTDIYVLTAAHLVRKADRIEVSTFTEDSYPNPAKMYDRVEVVERTRDIRDLALLRFTTADRPPTPMALCAARQLPAAGEFEALSVGCGESGAPLCVLEKVRHQKRISRPTIRGKARFWEVDVEQAAGRSGGPLVDPKGRLIGLASGASEGKGYYCHGSEIVDWLGAGKFAFLAGERDRKGRD